MIQASPPPTKPRFILIQSITMGAALLAVLFLWRQQTVAQKQMAELNVRNLALRLALQQAQAEIDNFNSGDSSAAARERSNAALNASRTRVVPEEQETLSLQPPSVESTEAGLTARFEFKPIEGANLPGKLTLVIRVPTGSDAKILSFEPADKSSYGAVECIVDARGKLAMIEGSPTALRALSFKLSVTAPVKALVRGSEGIKDFELDFAAEGCTVRPL